jgi:hypothetical protein
MLNRVSDAFVADRPIGLALVSGRASHGSVLARSALTRVVTVAAVLIALWLAVAWAASVP